jgi:hypothetical protein
MDDDKMFDEDKLKTFLAYAEVSRKWVTVMDAKAGFIAALNLGMLAFLWTGAKLSEVDGVIKILAITASILSLVSIMSVIWSSIPRESLVHIFGVKLRWKDDSQPISFYGYIAIKYGPRDFTSYERHVRGLTTDQLAHEALKQHFVISHSVARKSAYVKLGGWFLMTAILCVGGALLGKYLCT